MTLPMSLGPAAPTLDGRRDGGLRLGLVHLLRQELLDDGDLGLFLVGEVGRPACS